MDRGPWTEIAMTLTIIQPAYLPWLGFFERVSLSDVLVVLDHVAMDTSSKTNFTNRNKIRTPQGSSLLTVPLKRKGKYGKMFIDQVEIDHGSGWAENHWNSIKQFYARADFFKDHYSFFETVYKKKYSLLADFIRYINEYLFSTLHLSARIIYSSALKKITTSKSGLIVDICKELEADTYISGPFGRTYLDMIEFKKNNINLFFHDYLHPEYKQQFPGFLPNMSIIDLLFNYGPASIEILKTTKNVHQLSK